MKIIHKLLVPTDFSDCAENAFLFALQLAWKWKASVQLLHLVEPDYGITDLPVLVDIATKEKIDVAKELIKTFQENGMVKAKQAIVSMPVVTNEVKVSSLPYSAISKIAEAEDFDLIVMGTNDYHSAWENAFGTNSTAVLGKAECNVLVVPENDKFQGFSNVGFAADLHVADPYHLWRFCKMMEPFHSVVRCAHIEKSGSQEKTALRIEELKEFFANNAVALQLDFQTIEEDTVETGLETFANDWNLDLLAMPSPHRDVFSQVFHKSMTKQMALHSKVPLLVLK